MNLAGETTIVTGGGRGIGEAVALEFARAGANLVLFARTRAEVERVAHQAEKCGARAVALSGDVSRRSDTQRLAATARKRFGRIDVLVNAAGVYGPIGPLVENDMDEWARAIEINLLGTVFCLHAVMPHMIAQRKGVVVNFSGGGAVAPFPCFSAYGASKAAVVRLTETVAEEVKPYKVRINTIAPGAVNTRLLDQVLAAGKRAGAEFYAKSLAQKSDGGTPPERAAELAVFLASPAAAGITGRLISAVWDDWKSLPAQLDSSALFTLRRIDGRQFAEIGR
jgi:NAD(P)-dependent dehydrogenase (short-subunit alcohol dehydrogenase family)